MSEVIKFTTKELGNALVLASYLDPAILKNDYQRANYYKIKYAVDKYREDPQSISLRVEGVTYVE